MFIFVQNLKTWVKHILEMMYNQLSNTDYTQKMFVFEGWFRMVINEALCKNPLSSFISGDINLLEFNFFQNLKTWVKCISANDLWSFL